MSSDSAPKVRSIQSLEAPSTDPPGETLASAGDDGNILLWVPADAPTAAMGEDHSEDKESWRVKHMIRTSTGAEIYDLAWSPDGMYFITGGMDNTTRIYNGQTGTVNPEADIASC
jgi:chromatin assembly factor 1 subunit B